MAQIIARFPCVSGTRPVGKARWLIAALLLVTAAGNAGAAVDKTLIKSQEAASALLRGRFDQAVASYSEALKDTTLPTSRQASLYSDRGVAKWRLKQLDAALADFTKAVSLSPDYAPAYNNRGNVYLELDRIDDAFKDFDRAVSLSPGFGAAYNNRANIHQRQKRPEAAEEDFRKAIEFMPTTAAPFNGRGRVAGALGKPYTALRYLNRAIGLNAQYTPAYQNRALIMMRLERYDDAIQDLDKVITLMPENAELHVRRGQAHAREKKSAQAFRDFSRALELDRDNPEALIGRAEQNIERKRPDLAIEDVNQALALDQQNAEAYFWRGQAKVASGNVAEGEKDLTKAIELDPKYSEAYRVRGDILEGTGQLPAAIADYRKALELDPFSRTARDAYKAATGEPADTVVKPIAPANAGWEVFAPSSGRFVAVHERYPRIPVLLEMQGEGTPQIMEWTPLKDWLSGIGLLRYKAGEKKGRVYESVAIIDLSRNQVVTIEPYIAGDAKAKWDWTQNTVTVTDFEGLASLYELKKAKPEERPQARVRQDDPWDIFGTQSRRGDRGYGRERGQSGIFGWIFR